MDVPGARRSVPQRRVFRLVKDEGRAARSGCIRVQDFYSEGFNACQKGKGLSMNTEDDKSRFRLICGNFPKRMRVVPRV